MKLTPTQLQDIPVFGIAGNFVGHLRQAGENVVFATIKTADPQAPKGIFPIYIPGHPSFLNVYPLSHQQIQADLNPPTQIQVEPEMCILFEVTYNANTQIDTLKPHAFTVFNDCSIRFPNRPKLSQKKNWGAQSTGIGATWQPITHFEAGHDLDYLHLTCFINRDNQIEAYGVDSPVKNYQYFYQRLINWCITVLNTQADAGPLEHLPSFLTQQPKQIIITLGATRYTTFGETEFIKADDTIGIFLYDERRTSETDIKNYFAAKTQDQSPNKQPECLALIQTFATI